MPARSKKGGGARWRFLVAITSVVCWFSTESVAQILPFSFDPQGLQHYANLQIALDAYLQATEAESRAQKANIAFDALAVLAEWLQPRIPRYLHMSLPYGAYLSSVYHQQRNRNQNGLQRPNTPQEIRQVTEKWMCVHLVHAFTSQVDVLYALQFLHSDEYRDDQLDDIAQDIQDHIESMHQLVRVDILMSVDDPTTLSTYDALYKTCIAKNLAAIGNMR